MKGAALGMTIILIAVIIAVLNKDANKIPGANAVGVKSNFVEPGLWLEATRPPATTGKTTTSAKGKPAKAPAKAKPVARKSAYPKNVPYGY